MRASTFFAAALVAAALPLTAYDSLGPDKVAMLQDSGGWVYLSMDDSQNGFPTQHTCFDGNAHPDECSGRLTFSHTDSFVQQVSIQHQTVSRHGTYKLDGNQLAFFDEFGTRDGPYTVSIDADKKLMSMNMPQVRVRLVLYKEYRRQLDEAKKRKQQ